MSVREIRGWAAATPLPHAPSYVRGMVNLRGVILPVVDLGSRLGLGDSQPDCQTAPNRDPIGTPYRRRTGTPYPASERRCA